MRHGSWFWKFFLLCHFLRLIGDLTNRKICWKTPIFCTKKFTNKGPNSDHLSNHPFKHLTCQDAIMHRAKLRSDWSSWFTHTCNMCNIGSTSLRDFCNDNPSKIYNYPWTNISKLSNFHNYEVLIFMNLSRKEEV